jgi:3-phenylpropionate/trans-cinnamate dioxygenase ferredoxin reductase component
VSGARLGEKHGVLVAGGSIAALTAASALRLEGYAGPVTVLCAEPHPPYTRVPLSKGVLAGREDPETVLLPAVEGVRLRLETAVTALDPVARVVTCAGGERLRYDGLVIATGARARRLAAPKQRGELTFRTLDDAAAVTARLPAARSVIVVGGGFLGMEIASCCRERGLEVTVVDRDPPLRRLLGYWLADRVVAAARERGVRFRQSARGVRLLGGTVVAVDCGDHTLAADVVISAAGDVPVTEWLAGSGLPVGPAGVAVDERCRVAPGIVAAGDVASRPGPTGRQARTPHWTNAVEQALAAASALLHGDGARPYRPDPYFWTEQFGLDINISGVLPLAGDPAVLAGAVPAGALLQWTGGSGRAAVTINHQMAVARLKRLGAQAPAADGVPSGWSV